MLAGWVAVVGALGFLALRCRALLQHPTAPSVAILGGLLLFSGHAFLDFLLFIPHLTLLAVTVAWLYVIEASNSAGTPPHQRS